MKARIFVALGALLLPATFATPVADAAAVPGTTCNVFPADNIWNTDISTLPVNASSTTWVNATGGSTGRLLHPDFGGPPYGIPFNVVSNSHATVTPTFTYSGESDIAPYPWGNDLAIEGPTDSHMLSINKDTCKLYETFATDIAHNRAGSGAIFDLNSDALRTAGFTSADAAGLPIFPGLVRLDEVQAGFIGHAIRFTVHNTNDTYIWPARHHAGISDVSLPPMGARFRLKQAFDISTFNTATQVVLTAFKHYGLIVADNGSDWFFQGSEDAGWNNSPYDTMIAQLKTIRASAFEAVDESSLMVGPNSAQAGHAPSAPVAPTAVAGNASAIVQWTAPANGGQPITGYTITGTPGGLAVVSGSATVAVVKGLSNGTSYTFTVKAANVIGPGLASPPSNAVIPTSRPAVPQSSPVPPGGRPGVSQSSPAPPPPPRIIWLPPAARRA